MDKSDEARLVERALANMNHAYAPYSNFRVGAALLSHDGTIIDGVNVENASYGLTICAERNAIFTAVGRGLRDFKAIAVVGDADAHVTPCGACRQVLAEFSKTGDLLVICADRAGGYRTLTLAELLPHGFTLSSD